MSVLSLLLLLATPAWSAEPPLTDVERREHTIIARHAEAFRLGAPMCERASTDACSRLIETRLNLFRTAKVREALTHPAVTPTPRALLCEGVAVLPCLRRSFGSDWLSSNAALAVDRVTFVSARRRGDDRVQLVLGEVFTDAEGGATHVVVLADDTVTDPLLAAMAPDLGVSYRTVGPREALEADGYVVIAGSSILATNRPLRADEAVYAVCDQRVERVARPQLTGIGIAEVEWGDGGVYPEYRYALPCAAQVVLSGNIQGIRTGPYAPVTLGPKVDHARTTTAGAVTVREAWEGRCSVEGHGAALVMDRQGCYAVFVGDVTGDARADVVLVVTGEMGCGGVQLYLSGPLGWSFAGSSGWYC